MPLQQSTRDFLIYLQKNKPVRDRIKADRDKTLLYAGVVFAPAWREMEAFQRKHPGTVQMLPDVLKRIAAPPGSSGTLNDHVLALTRTLPPADQLVVWKALSGILASNAEGTVYFYVGSGVDRAGKVFPSTEISVLARNPKVSYESKQLLEYYLRCVRNKQTSMNMGFLPGD
jgi:hypothetical protein